MSDLVFRESQLPQVLDNLGERAQQRFLEFFIAEIRNANTREAYYRAASRFFAWCSEQGLELAQVQPVHVAAYIELLCDEYSAPTVKQHLAAIRMLFDYLVTGQVVPLNPAAAVRGPKHVVKIGKTPVLTSKEARELLESIPTDSIAGLRDRAFISVMLFSFGRVSAVCHMKVEDFHTQGHRWFLRLNEKGGKAHVVPCHHQAEEYLRSYIEAAELAADEKMPLFQALNRDKKTLSGRPFSRVNAWQMVRRRALQAGITSKLCNHSFRATGITVFMENGGDLETAAAIAAHESPRTTKLYDRSGSQLDQSEIERIHI